MYSGSDSHSHTDNMMKKMPSGNDSEPYSPLGKLTLKHKPESMPA